MQRASIDAAPAENRANKLTLLTIACLLATCSDLLLISQRLSFQSAGEMNVVGIRDAVLMAVFLVSTPLLLKMSGKQLTNPLLLMTCCTALYALVLAYVGIIHNNDFRAVGYELVVVWSWLIGWCVLASVKCEDDARFLCNVYTVLGVLVAVGVFGEMYWRVPLVTGATGRDTIDATALFVRPVPTGWLFLTSSSTFLVARLAFVKQIKWPAKVFFASLLAFETIAGILTQTRSLQVTFVASLITLCYLMGKRGVAFACLGVVIITIAWTAALGVGARTIGPEFAEYMAARYSVFADAQQIDSYSTDQLRPLQLKALATGIGGWAIWGSGLGDPFPQVNPDMPEMTSSDVSLVYMATRFGIVGETMLLVWAWFSFHSVRRLRRNVKEVSWIKAGFAANLVGIFVSSMFANTWALSYTAVPASIMYFTVQALRKAPLSPSAPHTDPLAVR